MFPQKNCLMFPRKNCYKERGDTNGLGNCSIVFSPTSRFKDEVDLTKPFTQTIHVDTESETPGILTLTFTPKPQTRGSSTNEASVGTWTSSYTGINNMSYQFDLEKVGTQWKMSNPRNHTYSRVFTTFSNPSLKISRATSTNTFPCEINASVTAELFDNQWISLGTELWYMYTTVTHDGVMTLYW